MKRLYNLLTMVLLTAVVAVSMTSCMDEDVDQAYDMNGIWQGTIQGNYYSDRYYSRDNSWDTEIQFVQDGDFSNGGYGVEIDYSYNTGRSYRSDFYWEVRNGRIIIDYDDGYTVSIRDYDLYSVGNGMRFRGYLDDYRTGEQLASFNLVKISDWTDYAKKHTAEFGE